MIGPTVNSDALSNVKKYLKLKNLIPIALVIGFICILILSSTNKQIKTLFETINSNFTIFNESLNNPLIQRSIFASVIVGTICAIVGVFVLLRGLVFLGEAVTHSAFAGVTFGLLFAIEPIYTTILFAIFGVLMVGYVNEKQVMNDEIIIGVTFTLMMALAVFFIGLLNFYSTDVNSILFGTLLFIPVEEFNLMIVIGFIVVISVLVIKKELYFMTFDIEMAKLSGIHVRLLNYIFLILVALTISISIRGIGALLVFAMVIVPAAAAYQWTFKLNKMILLSVIFGNLSTLLGFVFSFVLSLPVGSAIVIVSTIIFFLSFIYSPKREATKNIVSCKYCNAALIKGEECQDCLAKGIKHVHDGEITRIALKDLPEQEKVEHYHNNQGD